MLGKILIFMPTTMTWGDFFFLFFCFVFGGKERHLVFLEELPFVCLAIARFYRITEEIRRQQGRTDGRTDDERDTFILIAACGSTYWGFIIFPPRCTPTRYD